MQRRLDYMDIIGENTYSIFYIYNNSLCSQYKWRFCVFLDKKMGKSRFFTYDWYKTYIVNSI